MTKRSAILNFLMDEYYDGSVDALVEATGYSKQQVQGWLKAANEPQKATIEYIIHCRFTCEFTVIAEYARFHPTGTIRSQLKKILSGHEKSAGIYAFYDSMANLIYIGKATSLLDECYQRIRAEVHIRFPKGAKSKPKKRYELVHHVSAYDVGSSNFFDYPKHVESLILRISKPILNKNIGGLEKAYVVPNEG